LELNWTTFLLEIINFLVLIWILKRFLYKPVLDIIARRRSDIEAQLSEGQHLHEEVDKLKAEYENRITEWNKERKQLKDALMKELDEERHRQLTELQETLAARREKAEVSESRKRSEAQRDIETQALKQGAEFASRLLNCAAGQELETRLVQKLIEDLGQLSTERISALRTQWGEAPEAIQVISAYPLAEDQRKQLEQKLVQVSGLDVPVDYEQDEALLAGLRIVIGVWALHLNLQDELKGFAEIADVAG
jgi:F-type H+-transporting ATPase subunit b